jgi:hypothetical protein
MGFFTWEKIMSALPSLTERQRFWHQHLQQAQEQQVPLTEYAQQHGLSTSALYAAKGVLKSKGVLRDETAGGTVQFSAVRVIGSASGSCTVRIAGLTLELSLLPSPTWLAALSQSLERGA